MSRQEWDQLADEIARRVKALRADAGLSQEKLAGKMGMSRQTVFEIEHATRLAEWETYGKLADALGVEVSDVLPLGSYTARYLTPIVPTHGNPTVQKISSESQAA